MELPLQLLKKMEGELKKSIFESYFKKTETHVFIKTKKGLADELKIWNTESYTHFF